MLNVLISILFGIVEGITEWLPVSSTGHMLLLKPLVPFTVSSEFYILYEVVIQFGAILAVILLFWNTIFPLQKKHGTWTIKQGSLHLWFKIIISCLPAAVIGLKFDDFFEDLFYKPGSVAIALIVFGIAFIGIEYWHKGKQPKTLHLRDLSYRQAIYIGLFQVLAAIFPGTSRSGATILGALLLGISRSVAAEYTFYLAIPVMAGASLLKIAKFAAALSVGEFFILFVGMLTAFIVSLVVIKRFLRYVRHYSFIPFGIYRIILGVLVIVFFGFKGVLWAKV